MLWFVPRQSVFRMGSGGCQEPVREAGAGNASGAGIALLRSAKLTSGLRQPAIGANAAGPHCGTWQGTAYPSWSALAPLMRSATIVAGTHNDTAIEDEETCVPDGRTTQANRVNTQATFGDRTRAAFRVATDSAKAN